MAHPLLSSVTDVVMIDGLFQQPNYVATKKLLDATVLRQEAIASNLAHLETPGYQRVDVSSAFQSELQRALETRDAGRIAAVKPSVGVDASAAAANLDGNTVQLESELLHLQQNTVAHSLETQLITGTLLKLRLAITGRPF